MVKEFTGHTSDAVDKYQVTSNVQRAELSKVIQGESEQNETEMIVDEPVKIVKPSLELCVTNIDSKGNVSAGCTCTKKEVNVNENSGIGEMLNSIVTASRMHKAKIKIEIEFSE